MKRKLLAAASLAACAFAGSAQAQISDGIVKIGVMNDMSGVYADIGGPGSVTAAKMAVEDYIKATGSKLKVEVVSADHQNKPDIGSNVARQWYDTDKVDMIVDVPTSSVGLAIAQVSKEKNKVHVNTGSATADLSGKSCNANTVHWLYDTWMLANGTGKAIVKNGGNTWFFLTADYAFGHALERDNAAFVRAAGGRVLGQVRTPFPGTTDFSSYLLSAQASGAKVIGLANAGKTVRVIVNFAPGGAADTTFVASQLPASGSSAPRAERSSALAPARSPTHRCTLARPTRARPTRCPRRGGACRRRTPGWLRCSTWPASSASHTASSGGSAKSTGAGGPPVGPSEQ